MQVSVEIMGGLQRRITVQVPGERIDSEVASRLSSVADDEQRSENQIREEVISGLTEFTLQEALAQENLSPAGEPEISHKPSEPGAVLEYSATFEVYPEIELQALDGVVIDRPTAKVEEQDLSSMLEALRLQQATWNQVSTACKLGDQLVIDFEGTVEGQAFAGNKATATTVVLGSGALIDGFEEQLVGSKVSDPLALNLKFPEDYFNRDIAGKDVLYQVVVRSVSERVLPDLDDAFAATLGVDGGISALRDKLMSALQHELHDAINVRVKDQVLTALVDKHGLEVPAALVKQEIMRVKQEVEGSDEPAVVNDPTLARDNLPDYMFEEQARRQVALSLLIRAVMDSQSIQLDRSRVEKKIQEFADSYENPAEVIEGYKANAELMQKLEVSILEEQVVEWCLQQMEVKEVSQSFDDLVNKQNS